MRSSPYTKLLLVLALWLPVSIATAQDPPATQPVKPIDPVEQKIVESLPLLAKRATGEPAVQALEALREAKVLNVFKHIDAARVVSREGQFVVVYDEGKGTPQRVYGLFVELDEQDQPVSAPLEELAPETIGSDKFLTVNGLVRKQIGYSLLALGLKVDDPKVRRLAARDIGNKQVGAALPELRKFVETEKDPVVLREARESLAMLVAVGKDPAATSSDRAKAIAELGEFDSIRALSVLKGIRDQQKPDAEMSHALTTSIEQIEWHITVTNWIKNCFYGLSAGSILVLLALGLAITFGLMGVINMAHGEMLMIGAVTTWACCEFIGKALPEAYFDYYYVIAFPLAFLAAAGVGLLIEVTIVRHLYKRPLDSLLATIGVSYMLIQGVRLWKGDNLGLRRPGWANGNFELMQDVNLSINRLFLIALALFCVVLVVVLFRYTRIGLMMRATVQNREMAQALGVNTRLVDMFTFAFGAGLAGLAGYGIVLYDVPKPDMGQTYIVKTFLTVVVGGVGKLVGVVVGGLGIGFSEKLLEPITLITQPIKIFDPIWAQVATLLIVILFMQRKPAGLFPDKGRMADQADKFSAPLAGKITLKGDLLLGGSLLALGLLLVPLLYATGLASPVFVNKLGYIVAFAICAIGLDLLWGYIGVLSLCQFLFFAIGGYCMGLHLINHGPKAPDGIPQALSVVMSDVGVRQAPWFLQYFNSLPATVLLGLAVPGALALLIGISTFRSRVRGVYFSILTQAITVGAWLLFQKNELKLGGTNGLTNFTHIAGARIEGTPLPVRGEGEAFFEFFARYAPAALQQPRFWMYVVSCVVLLVVMVLMKMLVNSGFGRVLVAIRDDETRLRFVGYQTWAYKAVAFTIAGMLGAVGGMLYAPQKGIITPSDLAAVTSILVVAWVAIGGRGSLWGAVLGAIGVSLLYDFVTSWKPDYWLFVLGGLFALVPLLFPGGLMSIPQVVRGAIESTRARSRGFDVEASPKAVGGH